MTISYPTSLDTLPKPTATTEEDDAGFEHDIVHTDLASAIEALEAKVGVTGSAVTTSLDYQVSTHYQYSKRERQHDDMVMANNLFGTAATGSGASVAYTTSVVAGRPGIATLTTGTTTTGRAIIGSFSTSGTPSVISLGSGAFEYEVYFRIPTLSDGTDTFLVILGLGDNTGGGTPTDGVFISYIHSLNSGKFEFVTRSNNVETGTRTDTGITATAGQWYKAKVVINAAGTQADLYMTTDTNAYPASPTVSNSANIPTGVSRAMGFQFTILKSAGTNSRTCDIDLIAYTSELTTER